MRYVLESLEGRRLLSLVPLADAALVGKSGAVDVSMRSSAPLDASNASTSRALLSHLTGALAQSLAKTLRHSGPEAMDATLLRYMIRRPGPRFFFNGRQIPRDLDYARQLQVSGITNATTHANAILDHIFPQQNNSERYSVQLGPQIEWSTQPASTDSADFLHALNRHGYWKDLAIAYRATGDGAYVRELVAELKSWAAQAPTLADPDAWPDSSPRWWLLDASDRANNWTYAYFLLLGSPDWTPAANTLFLQKLWEHGDFLSRARPSSYRTNKTAVQASGLLRTAIMFPEFAEAGAWETRGVDMTFRCLAAQFHADGGHIEQTPAYAVSAIDSFLENNLLGKLNGRTYWTRNRRRLLQRTVEAVYQLVTPAGTLPSLSDTYRNSGYKNLLIEAGRILGTDRYGASDTLESILMFGTRRVVFGDGITLEHREPAYSLPDSGYYVMRGGTTQIVADAGPKGGTHGHYDLLSFEWDGSQYEYVRDPGPLRYDQSADRQYIISTPAHNTISIDGVNHAEVEGSNSPYIVVDGFSLGSNEARFTAHHHAYEFLKGEPTVGRTIWFDRTPNTQGIAIIVDWGRSDSRHSHEFASTLNLPEQAAETSPGVLDYPVTRTFRMHVQSLLSAGQTSSLVDAFVSNAAPPDEKTPSKRYMVSQSGTQYISVTVMGDYTLSGFNPLPPAAIAWTDGHPPAFGQPVRIDLTMPDGNIRTLTFNPPNLEPLPRAGE